MYCIHLFICTICTRPPTNGISWMQAIGFILAHYSTSFKGTFCNRYILLMFPQANWSLNCLHLLGWLNARPLSLQEAHLLSTTNTVRIVLCKTSQVENAKQLILFAFTVSVLFPQVLMETWAHIPESLHMCAKE